MSNDLPVLDLDGYRRLLPLEREFGRSPVVIGLIVAACIGLLVVVVGAAFLLGWFASAGRDDTAIGIVVTLTGALLSAASVGLGRVCKFRALARLRCPHCGGALTRYVADQQEAEQGHWGERGIYLDGRRYSRPFLGEGDERPWVRAMKEVWACASCRAYLDGFEPHERTCTEPELERLRQHSFRKEAR